MATPQDDLLRRIGERRALLDDAPAPDSADLVARIRERRAVIPPSEPPPSEPTERAPRRPGIIERGRATMGRIGSSLVRPMGERRPAPERSMPSVVDVGSGVMAPGPRRPTYAHEGDPHTAPVGDLPIPETGQELRLKAGRAIAKAGRSAFVAEQMARLGQDPGFAERFGPEVTRRAGEMGGPEVVETPRVVDVASAAARGLAHGATGLAESVGLVQQYLGARTDSDALRGSGRRTAAFWEEKAKRFELPEELQGAIADNPSLMLNPEWLAYGVADIAPSIVASLVPGAGAAKYIRVGGQLLRWSPQVLNRLAALGGAITGGIAGGSIEGAQTFKEVLDLTDGDESKAAASAEMMTAASAALNALSVGQALKPGAWASLRRFLKTGAVEALTEYAEEPSEALIKMGVVGSDVFTPEMAGQQLKEGLNVVPLSFITGGIGGVAGAAASEGRGAAPETPPGEPPGAPGTPGEPGPPSPTQELATPVTEAPVTAPVTEERPGIRRRLADLIDPSRQAEIQEAYRDRRTGLPNAAAWAKAQPNIDADPGLSVVMADVRNLGGLNEVLGSEAEADKVVMPMIQQVAAIAGRFGVSDRNVFHVTSGDEIAIAAPPDVADQVARAIEEEIGKPAIGDTGYRTGFRVGVGATAQDAGEAMHRAKLADSEPRYQKGAVQKEAAPLPAEEFGQEAETLPETETPEVAAAEPVAADTPADTEEALEPSPQAAETPSVTSTAELVERIQERRRVSEGSSRPTVESLRGPGTGRLPDWAREAMVRAGLDPNRPLNDIDIRNPSVIEAIRSDPTLTEEQKVQVLRTGSPDISARPSPESLRAPGVVDRTRPFEEDEEVIVRPDSRLAQDVPELAGKRVRVGTTDYRGRDAFVVRDERNEEYDAAPEDLRRPGDEDLEAAGQRGLFEGEELAREDAGLEDYLDSGEYEEDLAAFGITEREGEEEEEPAATPPQEPAETGPVVQRTLESGTKASTELLDRFYEAALASAQEFNLPSSPTEIVKWADAVLGEDGAYEAGRYSLDDVLDTFEGAVNAFVHDALGPITKAGGDYTSRLRTLVELEEKFFHKRMNTPAMKARQQFSTPLPIADAAAYAAGVRESDKVLEPTAGTGNLINAVRGVAQVVDVNELEPRRVQALRNLGLEPTSEDALRLPLTGKRYNVVITNPPYGSIKKRQYSGFGAVEFPATDIAQRFVAAALNQLADGGRLVAVMPPNTMKDGAAGFREWLQENHTPVAFIMSPDGSYMSRGVRGGSVLMVVDKGKPATPAKAAWVPETADWESWFSVLHETFGAGRPGFRNRGLEPAVDVAPVAAPERAPSMPKAPAKIVDRNEPTEVESTQGQVPPKEEAGEPAPPRPAGPGEEGPSLPGGESARGGGGVGVVRAGAEREPAPGGRPQPTPERAAEVVASAPSGERAGPQPGTAADLVRRNARRRVEPAPGDSPERRREIEEANDSPVFAPYVSGVDIGAPPHPRLVVETRSMAGMPAPPITATLESSALKAAVARPGAEGGVSAEQVDAILRAKTAWQEGRGALVADNVGLGKTRIAAGLALEAIRENPQARILFTTKGANNVADAMEEFKLVATGSSEGRFPAAFVDVADYKGVKKGEEDLPIPDGPVIYFAHSYNFAAYVDALGDVGITHWLGDEAHEFKNVAGSNRGIAWAKLHGQAMDRGVRFTYFTATPAVQLNELGYLYGLGLWSIGGFGDWVDRKVGRARGDQPGSDTAVRQAGEQARAEEAATGDRSGVARELDEASKKGKKSFMQARNDAFAVSVTPAATEQVMREMKGSGHYIARDLWRGGVEFSVQEVDLLNEPGALERYNAAAALVRDISRAARKFGRMNKRDRKGGLERSQIQAYMKQLLFDMRLDAVMDAAEKAVAKGRQAVISVHSVAGDEQDGDIKELNSRLSSAINAINTEEVKKEGSGESLQYISLGDIPEALAVRAELLDRLAGLPPLRDPIATIEERFGKKKVAAITGKVVPKKRAKLMAEFQAGKRDVAIISRAGKVGISLHDVNGRRREMLVADYEWSADTFWQELGRVDRAGQKSPPVIGLYASNVAGERKFAATIAARMAGIGAASRGSAESSSTGDALDQFDMAGDIALNAMRNTVELMAEDDKQHFTGSQFVQYVQRWDGTEETQTLRRPNEGATMRHFLLELMMFPIDAQERVMESFLRERDVLMTGEAREALAARRTGRASGEVTRTTPLSDTHPIVLYEVKNDAGEKRGIIQGYVTEHIEDIQQLRGTDSSGRRKPQHYVQFTTKDGELIAGLELAPGEIRRIMDFYGRATRTEITPEDALEDLKAGDKVPVHGPDGAEWILHLRRDGRIEIRGATLTKHQDVLRPLGVVGYEPKGNYLHLPSEIEALTKFLKRFPPRVETQARGRDEDIEEDTDEDRLDAFPTDTASRIASRMAGRLERADVPTGQRTSAPDVINALAKVTEAAGKRIPMRVGRLGMRKASGWWNTKTEVIRTRSANNIPTAAHEVAHAIEKLLYGNPRGGPWKKPMAPVAMQRELVWMGRALYGTRKPRGGYKREGWAEFVRMWVTESDLDGKAADLASVAPTVLAWFEGEFRTTHPQVYVAMEAAREAARRWRNQGAQERAKASLVDPASPRARLKRAGQAIGRFASMEKLVEMAQPLHDLAREAERQMGRSLRPSEDPFFTLSALRTTHAARTKEMVERGMIDLAGNVVGEGLNGISPLVKRRRDDFMIYLWARHTIEEHQNGDRRDTGLSLQDAAQIVKELEDPRFELAAGKVAAWNAGVLDYAAEASPTFAAVVDAIRAKGRTYYMPLQREFEEMHNLWARSGAASKRSPVKRFKGSGRRVKDPFQAMIAQAERTVRQAHERMVLDQIIRLSQIEGMGHLVEEVPPDRVPVAAETVSGLLERINSELFRRDPNAPFVGFKEGENLDSDMVGTVITFFAPAQRPTSGGAPIVPIYEEGRVRWFEVDPKLYDALSSLDVYRLPEVAGLPIGEWLLGKPAAVARAGTTGLRASFGLIWNPMRDVQTMWVNTRSHGSGIMVFREWLRAMTDMAKARTTGKRSEWVDAWMRLGGEMAQPLGQDIPHTRRAARRIFEGRTERVLDPRNWFDFYRDFVQFPEGAPRVAELRAVAEEVGWKPGRRMTLDQSMAMLLASKQVTTDFTAAGELARFVNRMVPFHNAAIQGPRANVRAARRDPSRFVWRALQLTAVTLLLWWKNRDEDWYKEKDYRDRFLHWFFPVENPVTGKHELVKVPRAFEVGMLFSAFPEMALDSWYRDDPEQAAAWFKTFLEIGTPEMTPVLLREALEQAANRDFYFDRPIVSQGDLRKPAPEQYNEYTSRAAIMLGKAFNVSPQRVDHAVRGVFGPVGADLIQVLGIGAPKDARDNELADTPIVGRVFERGGPLGTRPLSIDKLYQALETAQLRQASDRSPETEEQRQLRLQLDDAARAVSALYYVRQHTKDARQREAVMREATAIAADALTAASTGVVDREKFSEIRKAAESRKQEPPAVREAAPSPRRQRRQRQ